VLGRNTEIVEKHVSSIPKIVEENQLLITLIVSLLIFTELPVLIILINPEDESSLFIVPFLILPSATNFPGELKSRELINPGW